MKTHSFSTQHLLQSVKTDIFHHIKSRKQLPAEANPQHLMLSLIYYSNLKNIMMTIKLKRSQKKIMETMESEIKKVLSEEL